MVADDDVDELLGVGSLDVPLPAGPVRAVDPRLGLLGVATHRVVDAGRLQPRLAEPSLGGALKAEGVGFEPTEARRTSTAFEAVPFVRSGILPGREASGRRAAGGEERPQQVAALVGAHAGGHRRPVVQAAVGADLVEAGDGAGLGVGGAVDEARRRGR